MNAIVIIFLLDLNFFSIHQLQPMYGYNLTRIYDVMMCIHVQQIFLRVQIYIQIMVCFLQSFQITESASHDVPMLNKSVADDVVVSGNFLLAYICKEACQTVMLN